MADTARMPQVGSRGESHEMVPDTAEQRWSILQSVPLCRSASFRVFRKQQPHSPMPSWQSEALISIHSRWHERHQRFPSAPAPWRGRDGTWGDRTLLLALSELGRPAEIGCQGYIHTSLYVRRMHTTVECALRGELPGHLDAQSVLTNSPSSPCARPEPRFWLPSLATLALGVLHSAGQSSAT